MGGSEIPSGRNLYHIETSQLMDGHCQGITLRGGGGPNKPNKQGEGRGERLYIK